MNTGNFHSLVPVLVLFADLDELACQPDISSYHPTIVAGDFNLEPYTDTYRLIIKGTSQCCGSGMVYPGSDHCSISDPDPGSGG
jgi:hypothetical protein